MEADLRRLICFVLPALLLCFFAWEKLNLNPESRRERQADGIYYFQVAQHVANGDGLRTSVSLYGQGLRDMPSATTAQPLWPLVLGYSARVMGLDRAAHWVPEAFYFASLLVLYLLANRLGACFGARELIRFRGATILDLGTVALAIFGTNAVFSGYTSKAYTEGLGFFLFFAALYALPVAATERVLVRSAAAGALASLAYLTRSQFALVPLAVVAALALVRIGEPRLRGAWLAGLTAAVGVVVPWILFLVTSLNHFPMRVLVDFAAYRENDALPSPEIFMVYESFADRLIDLLNSFVAAFHPTAGYGYAETFGPIVYAVPVALGVGGWQLWRRRREGFAIWPTGFDGLLVVATILVAGASLAPVHLSHMAYRIEWLFGWRHGLPIVLGIVVAMAYLWRYGVWMRTALLVLVAAGLVLASPADRYTRPGNKPPTRGDAALIEWVNAHSRPPVVVDLSGRWLVASSQAVAHVPVCATADAIDEEIRILSPDYVIIRQSDFRSSCEALRDIDRSALDPVIVFGPKRNPIRVYRPNRTVREPGFAPMAQDEEALDP